MIPKIVREIFNINGGDRLVVLGEEGEGIALVKAEVFENKIRQVIEKGNKDLD